MKRKSFLFRSAILSVIFIFPLSICVTQQALAEGFTLQGSIEIYKKGGKKRLKNYDNALVYLEGVTIAAVESLVEVDQRKKKFLPRLLPVVQGQVVRFNNMDRVEHNVFSTEENNSFDLGRYPKEDYRDWAYSEPGLYKIYCNIHKAMILDIVVVPNRYFAVTDQKGKYVINDVPAGEYVLKAWHIYGGSTERPISVSQDEKLEDITLNSIRVVREIKNHLNKYGKRYKKIGSLYR